MTWRPGDSVTATTVDADIDTIAPSTRTWRWPAFGAVPVTDLVSRPPFNATSTSIGLSAATMAPAGGRIIETPKLRAGGDLGISPTDPTPRTRAATRSASE